jgi:hypothetical protein
MLDTAGSRPRISWTTSAVPAGDALVVGVNFGSVASPSFYSHVMYAPPTQSTEILLPEIPPPLHALFDPMQAGSDLGVTYIEYSALDYAGVLSAELRQPAMTEFSTAISCWNDT